MPNPPDELGAHVSAAGGCARAPGRAAEVGAAVLQMFTKAPSQWREPEVDAETARAFAEARREHGVRTVVVHDSYLINLASPDPALRERSYDSFARELRRCAALGVDLLVTHPGNATDGDREGGLRRNAEAIGRALAEVDGETVLLVETTAGQGRVLGSTFEELAEILARLPDAVRGRVGVCLDTCHVFAAGYDLAGDYDGVMEAFDRAVGLDRLRLFHLNDSVHDLGSRKDRHAGIGEGRLGPEPFRRIVTDPRFRDVPKVLETPKGDDAVAADRENLARLRGFREEG